MHMVEQPLALVTGAAHRLGRVFALTLARRNYAILLHYNHSAEAAESTADEIRKLGVPVFLVKADLTDAIQIRNLFSTLDSLKVRLEVLVNSAAEMMRVDLRDISIEEWDGSIDLNLRAPFFMSQYAAKRMIGGGLIVNVTDAGLGKAWTNFPSYLIGKSGIETMTRLLAKSLAPSIRVNAIAPGLVLPSEETEPAVWEKLVNRLPLQHPVGLDEISTALEFLLGSKSITGQTIVLDGGYSLL